MVLSGHVWRETSKMSDSLEFQKLLQAWQGRSPPRNPRSHQDATFPTHRGRIRRSEQVLTTSLPDALREG